jgi:hypothetical protein
MLSIFLIIPKPHSSDKFAWTTSVALVPATKPNLAQTDELQIVAVDLTDSLGRALDGNDDGQPGRNFLATFGRKGVTLGIGFWHTGGTSAAAPGSCLPALP